MISDEIREMAAAAAKVHGSGEMEDTGGLDASREPFLRGEIVQRPVVTKL